MTDSLRYTLDQARRELAYRECVMHGHDWRVIERIAVGPTAIICERCGQSHAVAPNRDMGGKAGGK